MARDLTHFIVNSLQD
ncbi:two-component system connector SafA [Escherichia coli]